MLRPVLSRMTSSTGTTTAAIFTRSPLSLSSTRPPPRFQSHLACFSTSAFPPSSPPLDDQQADQMRVLREDHVAPATGTPLREIAAIVWRHNTAPAGAGHRSGLKVLARPLKGDLYKSWYPPMEYEFKDNDLKTTPKQERWAKKLKILRAGGKGPPKKGSGKRSK